MPPRLAVLGFGSLGGAIMRGAISAGVIEGREAIVVEPDDDRRTEAARLGCAVTADPGLALDAEQILLAVKPQLFAKVSSALGRLAGPTVVVSVMAAISSATIRQALGGHARVIRVMPNIPARVRAGVAAIAHGEGALPGDDAFATLLFASVGRVIRVEEPMIHAVTALSGSGPAYVFLLAEAMEQAGVQAGLEPHASRALAYQTILGAGRLLTEHDRVSADALRSAVTSPAGTTAAAMEVFFEREFPQIVAEAILAARDRSIELSH